MGAMRQTACFSVNSVTVDVCVFDLNCTALWAPLTRWRLQPIRFLSLLVSDVMSFDTPSYTHLTRSFCNVGVLQK